MSTPHGFIEKLAELSRSGSAFVSVTMVEAAGSTPQDAGSKMLVDGSGLVMGTIGGGKVEHQAITHAQQMLARPSSESPAVELVEWNLQRDVGMTCGGVVKLYFETYNHTDWRIVLFGAGHVAQAVVHCLLPLRCHITCIDPREEWLAGMPDSAKLKRIRTDDLPECVAQLPDDAFVICMTMGHQTDLPVLEAIFRQGREFPYLGVIGSRSKRAELRRGLLAAGIDESRVDDFHCPIGLPLGSNQPGEIAVSIVAQLIQQRDAWRGK